MLKYQLVWNNYARILICNSCHVGIALSELKSHMKNNHPVLEFDCVVFAEAFAPIKKYQVPSNGLPTTPPGFEVKQPCTPVEGLFIYGGNMCMLDGDTFPEEKSMRNHFDTVHNGVFDCA